MLLKGCEEPVDCHLWVGQVVDERHTVQVAHVVRDVLDIRVFAVLPHIHRTFVHQHMRSRGDDAPPFGDVVRLLLLVSFFGGEQGVFTQPRLVDDDGAVVVAAVVGTGATLPGFAVDGGERCLLRRYVPPGSP